ncbi:SMI1/KNR4 family protein [Frigoriglobus tundricola]|uniref:SMI1/KNR4 family protein n=1 Tax=Frigoriglobus tundricola TaxID=2774151 RepID=UPI00148EDD34|nr:SMI1/KNR4 family protein [Frigoriglobus tundricola]
MDHEKTWDRLLSLAKIEGQLRPVAEGQLDKFEIRRNIKLPQSYRWFCKKFGPGSIRGQIWINITAPEDPPASATPRPGGHGIEALNEDIWSTVFLDVDVYCPDPKLIRNGLFFGSDIYTHHYFWNTNEVTDRANNELAVYVVFREWKVYRLADSFESFIYDICLGKGIPDHGKLDYDPPLFEAAPPI